MRELLCKCLTLMVFAYLLLVVSEASAQTEDIILGSKLSSGFDMGVNSSAGKTDWLSNESEYIKMSYPHDQTWGSVFITVGKPKLPPRPARDFSAYNTLSIEMKGELADSQLKIGIKTNDQPDDGSETTIPINLTSAWKTYPFPLDKFSGVDLKKLYVVVEFVFNGGKSQTVYVRKVTYSRRSAVSQTGASISAEPLESSPKSLHNKSITPEITITHPIDKHEINTCPGNRPSILVQGTAEWIPSDSKLYLIVHPTQNDNVWANEILVTERQWISQAFLGGPGGLPNNDDTFEIFTTIRDSNHPLPSVFIIHEQALLHPSKITTVKVKIVTWFDRALAFGRDWQISTPISACITVVGAIIGAIIQRKMGHNKELKLVKIDNPDKSIL